MAKKATTKSKYGRKPVPIDLKKVEAMAGRGLTKAQIAANLGMSEGHFYARQAKDPDIAEACKKGLSVGIANMANALYDAGINGDRTAQIFFLKCRAQWRDSSRVELTGRDGEPMEVKHSMSQSLILKAVGLDEDDL